MVAKIIAVFSIALFAKTISGQCIGAGLFGNNILNPASDMGYVNYLAHASGPDGIGVGPVGTFNTGLQVTSLSPVGPTGITIQSDNLVIDGTLAVSGHMPFLGVVAVEGPLSAFGQGSVAYGCGNGNVGIVSEGAENLRPEFVSGIGSGINSVGCNSYNRV